MTYHCPTCDQPTDKPLWMIAREAGFIAGEHCTAMANRFGKLIKCLGAGQMVEKGGFHKVEGLFVCDGCKIYRRFTKKKVDKFGRESEVFCAKGGV